MIDHATLKQVLDYDPSTGAFTWLVRRRSTRPVGTLAGYVHPVQGRLFIYVMGKNYIASRLAWYWMTGEWPDGEIDHKDRNPLNNRWDNLRRATKSQNGANRGIRPDNSVGLKGVKRCRGKYQGRIRVHGKEIHLGTYDTPDEAHAAYVNAASHYFGDYARAA